MIFALIAANTVGWAAVQLGIAAMATRLDDGWFARDGWLLRVRGWERGFYRRWLRIRRWKRWLPDGAPWVGGNFRKKTLEGRDTAYLRRLVVETRRGELAHWWMLGCFPVFFFWNPRWAWWVMGAYALAANVPCVVVQRYNREVAGRLLLHRRRRESAADSNQD